MTPAKMFDGNLYVLVADAVQMAENAYKNGQADEREACAKVAETYRDWDDTGMGVAAAIRARGETSLRSTT